MIDCLDKRYIGDIEKYSQHVDFQTFLSQFQNEEQVNELEIQDLLNIDYEKLGEMKEKCLEYIDILSHLEDDKDNEEDKKGYRKLMMFFCEKLNVKNIFLNFKQIKKNEINIQVLINNIDKIDSFVFSDKNTQVYFDK